ncbi:MAG: hypothetical protein KF819_35840 [Labilithrix sp.]|nr:hypothetical protein [Labilithrix sp.]
MNRLAVVGNMKKTASLALVLVALSGCYHARVRPQNSAPAEEPRSATRHAIFWGLGQSAPVEPDCKGNGLAEVRASTNLGYTLLTVVTLGIWAPSEIQWTCAKDRVVVERNMQ